MGRTTDDMMKKKDNDGEEDQRMMTFGNECSPSASAVSSHVILPNIDTACSSVYSLHLLTIRHLPAHSLHMSIIMKTVT